ncbi:MAG TPA: type II toxin-antitoxin system RelE/ParE family toxin [Candidatus Sulfotelmatobacter sp.]|nr:type II toxin-antitoxin system RelE/ParE family toxin [Candidatus Sulfotelmatobacter sp.]
MLPLIEVREYLDHQGRSPYAQWFNKLNAPAAAKIAVAVIRMSNGNLSNVKSVGTGVFEYKVDFGPGYRIYFGKDGERLILLLGGGSKKRQQTDFENAMVRWQDYRQRKR